MAQQVQQVLLSTPCFSSMKKERSYETILTLVLALLVIYFWRGNAEQGLIIAALVLGVSGLLLAPLRQMIHTFWFWLADKIGFIMSKVVLSVIFILVVIPFGLLSRLFRKDQMKMKRDPKSYYHERNYKFGNADFDDPW